MKEQFVTYEQALALKELGFDEPCFGRYHYQEAYPMLRPNSDEKELVFEFGQYVRQTNVTILAPLKQQALNYFMNLGYIYDIYSTNNDGQVWFYIIKIKKGTITTNDKVYKTYAEAESACINKLINLAKINK